MLFFTLISDRIPMYRSLRVNLFYKFYAAHLVHHDGGLIINVIFQILWRHNINMKKN